MWMLFWTFFLPLLRVSHGSSSPCKPSATKVGGTFAPKRVCCGQLIFSDNFNELDFEKWQHENTLAGGGNWEFQYYNNNRSNSFAHDGVLYIRPSLMSDTFGEEALTLGTLNVDGGAPADRCTNPMFFGCERAGTDTNILNPIKSARIRTVESFSFRYGHFEIRAKMPAGDWLWPAITLMPVYNAYGSWPSSGAFDLVTSRGNRELYLNDVNIGTQQIISTLNYGPYWSLNGRSKAQWTNNNSMGFDTDFHRYQLEWTPDYIRYAIDDEELGRVVPGSGGFWELGAFNESAPNTENPWRYGTKMAPFDQKFYIVIHLAVGGTNGHFPDDATNPTEKPWLNPSSRATTDFWNGRTDWLPTWNLDVDDGKNASFQVDYVRVWAL